MSLFGRRSGQFGFSRNVGNALANPSYLGALGQASMLAGSMPQRLKAEEQQAEMMRILDSGDPQAIINYSLQQARATNNPELLASAQQAQTRLTDQLDVRKIDSLASLLSNPDSVNSSGNKILGDANARQEIVSQMRNVVAGNSRMSDEIIDIALQNSAQRLNQALTRRATLLVSTNPEKPAEDLVSQFEATFPGQGKFVRDAYVKAKQSEINVDTVTDEIFKGERLPGLLEQEDSLRKMILSGSFDLEEAKKIQSNLVQGYRDIKDGASADRVSTLITDLSTALADKTIKESQALKVASEEDQRDLHSRLLLQVFAPGATGRYEDNYEAGLIEIQKRMQENGFIYDGNLAANLRQQFTNQRDQIKTTDDGDIEIVYDASHIKNNPSLYQNREDYLRTNALIAPLASKSRQLQKDGRSLSSREEAQLASLNAQMAAIVTEVKNDQTEAKYGKDAIEAGARRYAALFANDLTQMPELLTVEGESSFFFPDKELFFTDQPIRAIGATGRNYYQIAQELLDPANPNNKAFISNIQQTLREDKKLLDEVTVENIQTVVKGAIDDLGILDADDKRTIALIAQAQAKDNMASSVTQLAVMGELETIIRKTEGIDENRRDSQGRVVRQEYIRDLMAKAMRGAYTKNPSAYAQAVEAYKTRDQREADARRVRLIESNPLFGVPMI